MTKVNITIQDGKVTWIEQQGDQLPNWDEYSKTKMSKKLAEILTSLLVDYIDRVEGINTGSNVSERIEQMFINGNFVSIEYWIEARLRNK